MSPLPAPLQPRKILQTIFGFVLVSTLPALISGIIVALTTGDPDKAAELFFLMAPLGNIPAIVLGVPVWLFFTSMAKLTEPAIPMASARSNDMPGRVRIWQIQAAVLLVYAALIGWGVHWISSSYFATSCERKVASVDEARRAVAAFFTSDARFAKKTVNGLREEGLTDDYLAKLQHGCPNCYLRQGEAGKFGDDPTSWYLFTSIAANTWVNLEIQCDHAIFIEYTQREAKKDAP